jgi:hypothetical protein
VARLLGKEAILASIGMRIIRFYQLGNWPVSDGLESTVDATVLVSTTLTKVEHHFTWDRRKDPQQLAFAERNVACDDECALEASRRSKIGKRCKLD